MRKQKSLGLNENHLKKYRDEIKEITINFNTLFARYNEQREKIYKLEHKLKPDWINNLFWMSVGVGITWILIIWLSVLTIKY